MTRHALITPLPRPHPSPPRPPRPTPRTPAESPPYRCHGPHGGTHGTTAGGPAAGFSVVEALIAAALLLIVTLGILPFFTRSILNNVEGARSTEVTNRARSKVEELYQLDFDSPLLQVPPGSTEVVTTEYYSAQQKTWLDAEPAGETPLFTRTVRVRQFSIGALSDNRRFDDGEALPGGVTPSFLHLKEIEVEVRTPDQVGALGTGKQVRLRTYKPF